MAGYIPDIPAVSQYVDRSVSLDKMASITMWRNGLYWLGTPAANLIGTMTSYVPIDLVSWSAAGYEGESGLKWWLQCVSTVMRHF